MKVLLPLLISFSLMAESGKDTEKQLRAKISQLEEEVKEVNAERAADEKRHAANLRTLQQENARIAMENNADRLKIANLTEANAALQSHINSQLEAAKFQASVAKTLSERVIVVAPSVQVAQPEAMRAVHEIRKAQIDGREIADARNEAVIKTVETAVKTADQASKAAATTLAAVKSQTSAQNNSADRIKNSILVNDVWLILVTLICDVLARLWYGRVTRNRLINLAILGARHSQGLDALKDAFDRMKSEAKEKRA
jgi:hypothetical protein